METAYSLNIQWEPACLLGKLLQVRVATMLTLSAKMNLWFRPSVQWFKIIGNTSILAGAYEETYIELNPMELRSFLGSIAYGKEALRTGSMQYLMAGVQIGGSVT